MWYEFSREHGSSAFGRRALGAFRQDVMHRRYVYVSQFADRPHSKTRRVCRSRGPALQYDCRLQRKDGTHTPRRMKAIGPEILPSIDQPGSFGILFRTKKGVITTCRWGGGSFLLASYCDHSTTIGYTDPNLSRRR